MRSRSGCRSSFRPLSESEPDLERLWSPLPPPHSRVRMGTRADAGLGVSLIIKVAMSSRLGTRWEAEPGGGRSRQNGRLRPRFSPSVFKNPSRTQGRCCTVASDWPLGGVPAR